MMAKGSLQRFRVVSGMSPAMPILEPEPTDASEFPSIVGHELESPPQGASRQQQVIGSDGRALTVQARTQLPGHASVFALERQDGDRPEKRPHGFMDSRRQAGISRQSIFDFHLRDDRNGQLRRRFLTKSRHDAPIATREVA